MIKVLRIDDRLMHAQVTFGWSQSFNVKGILIASDRAAGDATIKMAAQFAKPDMMKLWIKSVDDSILAIDKLNAFEYNTMILCDNVQDALKIVKSTNCIKYVNMGGSRVGEGKHPILGTIYVSQKDLDDLAEIEHMGIQVEVKKMITDSGYSLKEFL